MKPIVKGLVFVNVFIMALFKLMFYKNSILNVPNLFLNGVLILSLMILAFFYNGVNYNSVFYNGVFYVNVL